MKEEEIRPDNLMAENGKLHAKDVAEMLIRRKKFKKIACPACESKKQKFAFKKDGFNFVVCLKCGTLFINPRPSRELLADFYKNSRSIRHWSDKIFPASEKQRRSQIFYPRAKRIVGLCEKFQIKNGVLADIGAGFGTFCQEAKKLNFFKEIIAIEPSKKLARICRQKDIHVIEEVVENVNLEKVDVVTSFELIEHLFWPRDFLNALFENMSKNSLLILTTPNIRGFDLFMLGESSNNIKGPNHLNYFHPRSISLLLEGCGFETVEVLTPGKLDAELVRKKILHDDLGAFLNRPFIKYILVDKWESVGNSFQRFLADNNLSSHLWVVAKKK